jgi:hypothetical protein
MKNKSFLQPYGGFCGCNGEMREVWSVKRAPETKFHNRMSFLLMSVLHLSFAASTAQPTDLDDHCSDDWTLETCCDVFSSHELQNMFQGS